MTQLDDKNIAKQETTWRILHFSAQRVLTSGQRQQLIFERSAAERVTRARWDILAYHNTEPMEDFERTIPFAFRPMFLRALFGWLTLLRLSRDYDIVLMRHIPFDPFAFLFAPFVGNRISVHHSKAVEEMRLINTGLFGRMASWLERYTGRFGARHSRGILGVTGEIAHYVRDTHGCRAPINKFPNAVDPAVIPLAGDTRSHNSVNIIFICGKFSRWHGLDRLLQAIAETDSPMDDVLIHLIGELSDAQKAQINDLGSKASLFRVHGTLAQKDYRELMALADVGLGSMAMDRQNLTEGATLKVREMLASGLAVYSGHKDTALPESFPFYCIGAPLNVGQLLEFAKSQKSASRNEVRQKAIPFISKVSAIESVIDWMDETDGLTLPLN